MDENRTNRAEINARHGLFDTPNGVMTAVLPSQGTQNSAIDASDLPSAAVAYEVVLKDLHAKLSANPPEEMRATIEHAVVALDAVSKLPGSAAAKPPKPWSSADIEDEVAREQLDP